jgi:hypothetical protein
MTDIRYIRQTGPDPLLQVDTTWEDIRFPTSSLLTVGVNDPDLIKFQDDGGSSPGVYCYGFDNVVREDVFFQAQLPHSWVLTSTRTSTGALRPQPPGPSSGAWNTR